MALMRSACVGSDAAISTLQEAGGHEGKRTADDAVGSRQSAVPFIYAAKSLLQIPSASAKTRSASAPDMAAIGSPANGLPHKTLVDLHQSEDIFSQLGEQIVWNPRNFIEKSQEKMIPMVSRKNIDHYHYPNACKSMLTYYQGGFAPTSASQPTLSSPSKDPKEEEVMEVNEERRPEKTVEDYREEEGEELGRRESPDSTSCGGARGSSALSGVARAGDARPPLEADARKGRRRPLLPCSVCGKGFDRPSLLKRHSRTHTGEKPHGCGECGKRFSTSSSLNTHRRIHSGERPHACLVCGKRFTASSNLYYHRMTHTKDKPHKCSLCGKSFPTPGDLRSHAYVHSGCWPFRCPICNRGFSKHTNLRNHLFLHTGDKPHGCQVCGKKFALSCNLRAHTRTHVDEQGGEQRPGGTRGCRVSASLEGERATVAHEDKSEATEEMATRGVMNSTTTVHGSWLGAPLKLTATHSSVGQLPHPYCSPSFYGDDQQIFHSMDSGSNIGPWRFPTIPHLLAEFFMPPPDPFFLIRCTQEAMPSQGHIPCQK
ncbi:zinc finger protein 2-like [Ischnura elegans]|uniref:zinc finger protein 2-like n=1 Tax=Ischnura elegans TaxID=197161 RepID=UPI001ED88007|nr:zinc finger protein 2-like [Ischnura elegans]